MPEFRFGPCRIDFGIEPLGDEWSAQERQVAWRLLLEFAARPGLRVEPLLRAEVKALVDELRSILAGWPAAQLAAPGPRQLGVVVLEVLDVVLMPCLASPRAGDADVERVPEHLAAPVRDFCRALADELARLYRLPAGAVNERELARESKAATR